MAEKPTMRILRKLLPGANNVSQTPSGLSNITNGWRTVLADSGQELLVYQSYFDTSGFAKQELTFYPSSVIIQQGVADHHVAGPGVEFGGIVRSWDLVTTRKITDDELQKWLISPHDMRISGFVSSKMGLRQVIQGRYRQWVQNTTLPGFLPIFDRQSWGVLSDTAAEKIYITRIYQSILGTNGYTNIPDTDWVMLGTTVEEKDLVYIEQLRRSYNLSEG